jgi:hypothetical protein
MTIDTDSETTGTTARTGTVDERIHLGTVAAFLLAPVYGALVIAPILMAALLTPSSWVLLYAGAAVGLAVAVPFRPWRSRAAERRAAAFFALVIPATLFLQPSMATPVRGSLAAAVELLLVSAGAAGLSLAAAWYVSET